MLSRAILIALWTAIAAVIFLNDGRSISVAEHPVSAKGLDHNPMKNATIGQHYEAMVPDTLDLADRMDLAVNALTNVWFPERRWALGFVVDFSRRPAILHINHLTDAYLNIAPKFIEALAVCRLASGSTKNLNVDLEALRAQLSFLGEDGLTYCPVDALPKAEQGGGYSEVWGEGRMLLALAMLAQIDDDPRWIEIGTRKVDRLLALTRKRDGYRFFPSGRFRPTPKTTPDADGSQKDFDYMYSGANFGPTFAMAYSVGAVGHGAGLFYRVTGYDPALELSRGLAHWALASLFKHEDGHYDFGHFHHGLYALMAVCEYGIAAKDSEVLERVDACYRWARELGDPLIGFYPEAMNWTHPTAEICEIADMVFLGLCLTRAGLGDYWDDVDRWVRNMYAEGQLRDASVLDRIPDSYFNPAPARHAYQDTNDIRERMVGSFFGWMRPNEGLCVNQTPDGPKLSPTSIMHCCTANGARTLFYVWDSIVTESEGAVRVNLLLNRSSPWLDVDSYLPAEGKVVLHIKDARDVAVRAPQWCVPFEVRVTVGDQPRRPRVEGTYILVSDLKAGDRVTLTFPMFERVLVREIQGKTYKLTFRGSNVVDIDPQGVAYALFSHNPTAKLVKRGRFVPKTQEIVW